MAMQYFDVPPGTKVYTLNICEALKGDHDLCPGFTGAHARRVKAEIGASA